YVFPPKFPGQRPPALAEFVAKPLAAAVGATIQFTDLSNPGLDPITSWYWEFGDGTTSTVQNPTHAYTSAGQYTVKLRVTNIVGGTTKIRTNYITVN
ncbi:MAG TPA: PKD domain-containing protein, partial [Verrucomicrobiota bacterium]|nr:PKD domain-containing protein [Verrucomicrobiota bacterium]